jgi:hypothetical protein
MPSKSLRWILGVAVVVLVALALVLPACTSSGVGGTASGDAETGSLRVLITDEPFPFDCIASALVTVARVDVHRIAESDPEDPGDADATDDAGLEADAASDSLAAAQAGVTGGPGGAPGPEDPDEPVSEECEGDGECNQECDGDGPCNEEGGWITVFQGEADFDLLLLRNGQTDVLALADIPAGTYNQVRLVVTEGEITLTDERVFPLRVPSGEQTGIKLHLFFEVLADTQTTLLLDVDLSRAFKPVPGGHIYGPGEIREFTFRPSYGMRLVNLVETGDVSGTVTDADGVPLPGVSVTVFEGDIEISSTATAEDGTYTMLGLAPGPYTLEFSLAGYEDALVEGVVVAAGESTEGVDATLTAAASGDSETQ